MLFNAAAFINTLRVIQFLSTIPYYKISSQLLEQTALQKFQGSGWTDFLSHKA